ncbi:hypothetical protein MKEN_01385200 [Mycena kentingensis (nom. inval.)]|nr:hypothetical protein MKEN_01385200 [Mycena kentingensis (nom. inval.)]
MADDVALDVEETLLGVMHQRIAVMATHKPTQFGPDMQALVDNGYGPWVDRELATVLLDEPVVFSVLSRAWFPFPSRPAEGRPNTHPSTFIRSLTNNPPRTALSIAHCLVFYLSQVFGDARQLAEIFSFAVCHVDVRSDAYESTLPLATQTSALAETTRWFEHREGTAFCLPSSPNVDIVFILRLEDGYLIWVADSDDRLLRARAVQAIEALPSVRHRPSLLGVVSSYPVEAHLSGATDKRTRDVAGLGLSALRGRPDQVLQEEFFGALINGAIGGKRRMPFDDGGMHASRKRLKLKDVNALVDEGYDQPEPHYRWDEPPPLDPVFLPDDVYEAVPTAKARRTKKSRARRKGKQSRFDNATPTTRKSRPKTARNTKGRGKVGVPLESTARRSARIKKP